LLFENSVIKHNFIFIGYCPLLSGIIDFFCRLNPAANDDVNIQNHIQGKLCALSAQINFVFSQRRRPDFRADNGFK
jgi:hypothetical protein